MGRNNTAGFSMIEVLVSIVVLSVGLLGIAGMQAKSYRFNHDAFLRSIAISQTNSMIDRMRANTAAVDSGAYSNINFNNPITPPNCGVCSPSNAALRDVAEWNANNSSYLPAGRGIITYNANSKLYTIQVMWDAHKTGATGTNCSNNHDVDLSCVRFNLRL